MGSVSLKPSEVAELTKSAMAETYQRLRLRKEPRDPGMRCLSRENDEVGAWDSGTSGGRSQSGELTGTQGQVYIPTSTSLCSA